MSIEMLRERQLVEQLDEDNALAYLPTQGCCATTGFGLVLPAAGANRLNLDKLSAPVILPVKMTVVKLFYVEPSIFL